MSSDTPTSSTATIEALRAILPPPIGTLGEEEPSSSERALLEHIERVRGSIAQSSEEAISPLNSLCNELLQFIEKAEYRQSNKQGWAQHLKDSLQSFYQNKLTNLTQEEFDKFELITSNAFINKILDITNSIPFSSQLNTPENFGRAIEQLTQLDFALEVFNQLRGIFQINKTGRVLNHFSHNFFHDTATLVMHLIRACRDASEKDAESHLILHDTVLQFLEVIFKANYAILNNQFDFSRINISEGLILPAEMVSKRRWTGDIVFAKDIEKDKLENWRAEDGNIIFNIDPQATNLPVDLPSISYLLYQLFKNPAKIADLNNRQKMSQKYAESEKIFWEYYVKLKVSIKITIQTAGENCVSILVEDNGVGFNLDELYKHYTQNALWKQSHGVSLSVLTAVR
jgi:hypothetical protein